MELQDIIQAENLVYKKSALLNDKVFTFCPGCGHGTTHKIIMEVIQEMGIQSETIGVAPVGCAVLAYEFMELDMTGAAHGRAPAVATAIKRVLPDKYVFTYQGDGDLAAIGTSETIHTCNRGENITIIFVNNGIYGMTGGQMAPTSLEGMSTTTSPRGRDVHSMGYPLKITEMVAQLEGTYFVTRHSVHNAVNVNKAKRAIRKGFENQKLNRGVSFIEIVSNCNSNWKLTPNQSNKWLEKNMLPYYPLGDIKVDGELVKKIG